MSEATFDRSELDRLLAKLVDDVFTDEEQLRFEAILRDAPAARRHYFQYLDLHAELVARLDRTGTAPQTQPRAVSPVLGFLGYANSMLSKPVLWSILGVGVAFGIYATLITWGIRDRETPNGTAGVDSLVATIIDTVDAEWAASADKSEIRNLKAEIASGEPLQITSGLVELKLKQGATLLVEGPAEWSIDGDNAATLNQGKLIANVPKQAVGFTLNTPTAKIVDLGTEFGAEVWANGSSQVSVLKGSVETRSMAAGGKSVRLSAGQAVRLSASNPKPEAVPYDPKSFVAFQNRSHVDSKPIMPVLLFSDNFNVLGPSDDVNPGANDKPGRQAGLFAPLKYIEREGKAATTTQVGQPLARNGLLLSGDAQPRTCVSPAVEFRQNAAGPVRYSIEFLVNPGRPTSGHAEQTKLWAGLVFGVNEQIATVAGSTSGVGFLVRGNGGYQLWDCTNGQPQLAREGTLRETFTGGDLAGWFKLRIDYDVPAFDEKSRAVVNVTVNDRPLAEYTTTAGFRHNFVVLDGESVEGVYHAFDDFKVSFQDRSSIERKSR